MKKKFQIFISSTFTDLINERQAAVGSILKAGHIPAGMELFTSGDKSQMDTIQKWIDESDIYMLILGGRYGSIEPKSGVSYTELEYDYALEQGKPLFAIVINEEALEEKIKKDGTDVLEREHPQLLKKFRKKVLSNVSSFYDDFKDIKLCVHESLSDFISHRTLIGWVHANEITNTQPLLDEIGRLGQEIEKLKTQLINTDKKLIKSTKINKSAPEFHELWELLSSIKIHIPKKASKTERAFTANLFEKFMDNKEQIITGITNQAGTDQPSLFLYYDVCPKLQIHGLIINKNVTNVQWSRFEITTKGTEFLAYIEKRLFNFKKKQNNNNKTDTHSNS